MQAGDTATGMRRERGQLLRSPTTAVVAVAVVYAVVQFAVLDLLMPQRNPFIDE
jgi:hypothetical protein